MNKRKYIENIFPESFMNFVGESAEEIRIRINEPVIVVYPDREVITNTIYNRNDINMFMDRITKSSPYTFSDDIANGFITIFGGHRIGICGTAVYENQNLKTIKDISYINVRIAHELIGVGEGLFSKIRKLNTISNTLIISPPSGGKTTMIRDLTRLISYNMENYSISVIDERNEISATFMGEPQNDIGKRTDVLCGYNKTDGILRAIRSMAPKIVVLDEIGGKKDCEAIMWLKNSGVGVIATLHGSNMEDVRKNIPQLIENDIFEYYVFLDRDNRKSRIVKSGEIK